MEKEILEDIVWSRRKNTGILIVEDEEKLACIERAIEKQIPKRPLEEFNGIQRLKICLCGGEIYSYPSSFSCCPYCGQKINWN